MRIICESLGIGFVIFSQRKAPNSITNAEVVFYSILPGKCQKIRIEILFQMQAVAIFMNFHTEKLRKFS